MIPAITRRDAVSAWVRSSLRDFYLYFELDKGWYYYNAFFLHQGLEKLCKAYEIGKRASEYEGLPEQDALVKIDQMVKKLSHKLEPILSKLVADNGDIDAGSEASGERLVSNCGNLREGV